MSNVKYTVSKKTLQLMHQGIGMSQNLEELFNFNKPDIDDFLAQGEEKFSVQATRSANNTEVLLHFIHIDEETMFCEVVDDLIDIDQFNHPIDKEIEGKTLFAQIFKYSPIGLVLVDENTLLYKANRFIFSYFNLEFQEVKDLRFGNVFLCSEVEGSGELCGTADGCKGCDLRNGVESVLSNLITLDSVLLSHEFVLNNRKTRKHFQISASPVKYGEETFALVSFVDVTQRIIQEQKLTLLGFTDELTRLNNRRYINQVIDAYIENGNFQKLNVGIIDIDDFKHVNDTYGHDIGDKVLVTLSNVMTNNIRSTDHIARYGGEEFLIILPDVDTDTAEKVITRINNSFNEAVTRIVDEGCTFSCGVAQVTPDFSQTYEDIIKKADENLYKVKAKGKNDVIASVI